MLSISRKLLSVSIEVIKDKLKFSFEESVCQGIAHFGFKIDM